MGMAASQRHVTPTEPLLSFPFRLPAWLHLLLLDLGETVTLESPIIASAGWETGYQAWRACSVCFPAARS